jgi:hypothetical protein
VTAAHFFSPGERRRIDKPAKELNSAAIDAILEIGKWVAE